MSWLSAAFTRGKAAIQAGVSLVPVVGGVASGAIGRIHTGDEHFDSVTGVWVNNSDGQPTVTAPSQAVQAEIDRVNAFNKAVADGIRQNAADTAARIGASATLEAAARIGPEGNVYEKTLTFAKGNTLLTVGGVVLVLVILYLIVRD